MTISALIVLIALPHGTIQTRRASIPVVLRTDVVALEPASSTALEQLVRDTPGARVFALPRGRRAILGARDPADLRKRLEAAGASRRFYPVYTRGGRDDVLVVDGHVQVRFAGHLGEDRARELLKRAGFTDAKLERAGMNAWSARVPELGETLARVASLRTMHAVLWANADFIVRVERRAVPNDPLFDEQWHHKLIGSAAAWDVTSGEARVRVAVIDTGIDIGHPDFAGKIVDPRDTTGDDDDPTPDASFGEEHGTACSGIAAAKSNDGTGVAGVCPGCSLMPIRDMFSDFGAMSDSVQAFYWAADHGAHVISNSWGTVVDASLEDAVEYAATQGRSGKGSLVLFASGNDGVEIPTDDPAALPTVLAIGATSYWDELTDYSNFGAAQGLCAPDSAVTTDVRGGGGYDPGDYTHEFGGTSASCPTVAGVAGLVFSLLSVDATAASAKDILLATADKIGATSYVSGRNDSYGYGRVNALRAVQMASSSAVCAPSAEQCTGGLDEDCDGLADAADLSCAPEVPLVPGAECSGPADCGRAGRCFGPSEGFAGGYCTKLCESSDCPVGSTCAQGICWKSCSGVGDCRAGYVCEGGVCAPPVHVGSACESDAACGAAWCFPEDYGWPGGHCTVDCEGPGSDCPDGAVCAPNHLCLAPCTGAGDCRTGYACDAYGGTSMCVPASDGSAGPGGACEPGDCADNGTCLTEFFGSLLPGGYCSVMCANDAECPAASVCEPFGGTCMPLCGSSADCREGYQCYEIYPGSTPTCWTGCSSDADCWMESCNEHGLCGDRTPFVNPNPCVCDLTGGCEASCACDADCAVVCACDASSGACDAGCACDPACGVEYPPAPRKKKGCAAADGDAALAALLGAALVMVRRRRVP